MYIATTYIGSAYTPGEVLPDDLPAEKLEWLIRAGAVREAAPTPSAAEPAADYAETPADDLPEAEAEEEIFEEEAPEIDAMAGVVKDAGKPERKPSRAAAKGGKAK